jgi:MinD superfamily P-loop ATPase
VISSFSGADHVLIVTEATQSGLHDLGRLVELVTFLDVRASCVINKSDLDGTAATNIEGFCNSRGVDVINKIPYSDVFLNALQQGKTVMEANDALIENKINEIWSYLERTNSLS